MCRHPTTVSERSQGVNTAEKLPVAHECSCGKFFNSPEGVAACQQNKHGSGKDAWNDRHKFRNTVEVEYEIQCAECGEKLRFRMIEVSGTWTMIDVLPHVCAVDEGEV